jgi:hypothetical protein
MRAKIFLADSAEVREGLLFILGGGWTQVGPQGQPFAIAGLLEVDWDEANRRHDLEFTIEDEDGGALMVPTPTGDQPLRIGAGVEVGRPAGTPQGTSFNVPIALPLMPLPWVPGRRYVVKLSMGGQELDRLKFAVRAAPQPQQR